MIPSSTTKRYGLSWTLPGRAQRRGAPVEDFYRLFMVPGMGHCGGGVGPNNFGNGFVHKHRPGAKYLRGARTVGGKRNPAGTLIGTGHSIDRIRAKPLTRPLCPYPQVARYKGTAIPTGIQFRCAIPPAGAKNGVATTYIYGHFDIERSLRSGENTIRIRNPCVIYSVDIKLNGFESIQLAAASRMVTKEWCMHGENGNGPQGY